VITLEQRAHKARKIQQFIDVFSDTATILGKQIIEEVNAPDSQRQFPYLKGKGIAGGKKVISHGIFFKVSTVTVSQ
jgi:hypothetical protein